MRATTFISLLVLIALSACVNVFSPEIRGNSGQLVISGTITDQEQQQFVYISRTKAIGDLTEPDLVTGADVKIVDDQGLIIDLEEQSAGVYATPNTIKGVIGRFYHVEVDLNERRYESEPEQMLKSSEIMDIQASFKQSITLPGTSDVDENVVAFFADIENDSEASDFYKYDWDAVYTIEVPFRSVMDSCRGATDGSPFIPTCYVSQSSEKFLNILSLKDYTESVYPEYLITTVNPNIRFMLRYSINIKQYALTPQAYEYWGNIKALTQSAGGLFDPPPTRIKGNIVSTSNPTESVLGYFMASAVTQRREFFSSEVVATVPLQHFYDCDCEPWRKECRPPLPPDVLQPPPPPPQPFCCDCRRYPNAIERPDFWIE